jgi:pyruvate dehydrogenase E1 component
MNDRSGHTESSAISELDQIPDRDREETAEWQASLDAVVRNAGPERGGT